MTFLRYMISEQPRREVLARLLALNHQRYEQERKMQEANGKKAGKEPLRFEI